MATKQKGVSEDDVLRRMLNTAPDTSRQKATSKATISSAASAFIQRAIDELFPPKEGGEAPRKKPQRSR